jgi:hypothetical protein
LPALLKQLFRHFQEPLFRLDGSDRVQLPESG